MAEIKSQTQNPCNFSSVVIGGQEVTNRFIQHTLAYMRKKFEEPGDIFDIKYDDEGELRVIGFKHEAAKNEIQNIIWEIKNLRIPPEWEDVELLMFEPNKVIENEVKPESDEWKKIEANFKQSL